MKNIFKLLGIAALACSMMVACGPDETEVPDPTPTPDPQPQSRFVINFDGVETAVIDYQAVDHTDEGYLTVYGYTTENGQNGIFTMGYLESTVVANATYQSTSGDIMNYRDPNKTYYDAESVLGNEPATYWGWVSQSSTFIENVTAVDLNTLTMSANWTVNVVDIADYIANQGFDGCTAHPFTGEMLNATWAWASSSK